MLIYIDLRQALSKIAADSLAKVFLIESDIEKEHEIKREVVIREKEQLILQERGIVDSMQASAVLAAALSIKSDVHREMELKRDIGYRGAIEKLKRDPKQAAKTNVKERWDEWQLKPSNYKNKSAFARDMMSKYEDLENQTVIVRWCGQWEEEAEK